MFRTLSTNILTIRNALSTEYLIFPFQVSVFYNVVYILPTILLDFIVIHLNTLKTSVICIEIVTKEMYFESMMVIFYW